MAENKNYIEVSSSTFDAIKRCSTKRHLMFFECPHLLGNKYIVLFLNPQNITYNFSKVYSEQRVRGGYLVQYWGENLIDLKYDGVTGRSGVDGLQQLMLLYRHENLAMRRVIKGMKNKIFAYPIKILSEMFIDVTLHYLGWKLTGYFTSFSFNESIERLGFFHYSLTMRITRFENFSKRVNIFPWQYGWKNIKHDTDIDLITNEYIRKVVALINEDKATTLYQDLETCKDLDLVFAAGVS